MEPEILVPLSELGKTPAPAAAMPAAVLGEGRQIEEPAGLADFLASRVPQGAKSETVAFRRNAKGEEETLWTWNNEWPTEHDLGGKFGGGRYRVVTTILGTGAKKAPKHEWSFILPAYPWDSLAAANRAKEETEARNRAVAAIPAGGSADFRAKLEEMALLRQVMAEPPRPSFFETDAGKIVAGLIAAAVPKMLERLMAPPVPINQKDPSETFRETLAMTSQMLSIHKEAREIMQPAAETEPESPSWMSQAVGLLNDLSPIISGILATPAIMRPQGMLNRAQAAPEVRAAQGGTPFERQTLADEAVRVYGVKGAQELFAELKIPADGVEFRAQAQEGAEG